jgi:hypothetical protein
MVQKTRLELLYDYNKLLNKIILIQGDSKIQAKKYSANRINFAFLEGVHDY